ncbi:hypothetical protein S40285_03534 [Stachybotrys chlorohalonatus IBT 40285]|uniref:Hexosyltransferase n=1 Tax=Stachybotrys chlorohalonatus (strain IBT 40285) TaxID=1283841 RepID=A0A084QVJ0_STAC4|nr:hypothetical protein S40285_03534 [Stachybotrys chlorohalonata IBT 40285]
MDVKRARASQQPYAPPYRPPIIRCIPKPFLRIFVLSILITSGLLAHLLANLPSFLPVHHAPFEPPSFDFLVHGKHVSELQPPAYPLAPFPETPIQSSLDRERHHRDGPRPPWLAAVICAAGDVERRMMIRTTWMHLYRDVPFDGRFVVSNPGPQWTEIIRTENRTFGDMIVLDHLQEDDLTANTVKTLEFFKWLVNHGRRYEFVSKMDTDLWLNARAFWDRFLLPRMSNETGQLAAAPPHTFIGQMYYSPVHDLVFPHGSMYTVTWDMLELLVSLQDSFHVVAGEDMTNALLLMKGRQVANVVNMSGMEKFDYEDDDARGDGTAWARDQTHPDASSHALVGSGVVAVHQLKDKKLWMRVAECFDEDGVKEMPPPHASPRYRGTSWRLQWFDFWAQVGVSTRYASQLDRIPSVFWTRDNGSWIVDGIWNMGDQKPGLGCT